MAEDLAAWLLDRISEDEAAARLGAGPPAYPHYGDTAAEESVEMALGEGCAEAGPAHLARWLPPRVLAECDAKRRIVDRHSGSAPACAWTQDPSATHDDEGEGACDTLRALALPYADQPGWREEWRP